MTTRSRKGSGTLVNILLALLLLAGTAAATGHALAAGPSVGWNTFLGGNAFDEARAIARDGVGNLYIAGRSDSTWGNPILPYTAMRDCFIAKLNPSGALMWNTFLGGRSDDMCNGMLLGEDGNLYVTGYSFATWGNPTRAHTNGLNDAFVARLDPNSGVLAWNSFFGGDGYDAGHHLAGSGYKLFLTGFSSGTWGSPVEGYHSGYEAFAARIDRSTGILVWNSFLGGSGYDEGDDIAAGPSGALYIAGRSDTGWGNPVMPAAGNDDFVAKMDQDGHLLWNTFVGGAGDAWTFAPSIGVDGNENIYLNGYSNATWGNPRRAYSGEDDSFVAKLDPNGNLVWNTFLGWSGDDLPLMGMLVSEAGFVTAAGGSTGSWGTPALPHHGGWDSYAAKIDPNGNLAWNLFVGGSGNDATRALTADPSGNLYLAGGSDLTWGAPVRPFSDLEDGYAVKLDMGTIFEDVPDSYWAVDWIERLYNAGITTGCGTNPLVYCPEAPVSRAQMAIFLERGMNGADYVPPAGTGQVFGDVPAGYWALSWVEKLAVDGITTGCGGGNYCPEANVTRDQMAVFLLRAKHGANYNPPAAMGIFADVPVSHWAAKWIEQLADEGITTGCGGGNYCPGDPVTRAQMAVFLVRAFALP